MNKTNLDYSDEVGDLASELGKVDDVAERLAAHRRNTPPEKPATSPKMPAAETGFNDQSGINSDPTPGIPYFAPPHSGSTATIHGSGADEPGWVGYWITGGIVSDTKSQNDVVLEGDGAMRVGGESFPSRRFISQTGKFVVEQFIRRQSTSRLTFNVNNTNPDLQPGPVILPAYTTDIGPQWSVDLHEVISVFDGNGDGTGTLIDTGATLADYSWTKMTTIIDIESQTWGLEIDGVPIANDLGFLGNPESLNRVEYIDGLGMYVDALQIKEVEPVPEPTSSVIVWSLIATMGIASGGRRRRHTT